MTTASRTSCHPRFKAWASHIDRVSSLTTLVYKTGLRCAAGLLRGLIAGASSHSTGSSERAMDLVHGSNWPGDVADTIPSLAFRRRMADGGGGGASIPRSVWRVSHTPSSRTEGRMLSWGSKRWASAGPPRRRAASTRSQVTMRAYPPASRTRVCQHSGQAVERQARVLPPRKCLPEE